MDVTETWKRIVIDVTKFEESRYLTIIDCWPSRFSIWRLIRDKGAQEVIKNLRNVFFERGAPAELLVANYSSFHSEAFTAEMKAWNINVVYRAVNRPSENVIIEKSYRTVKALAARAGKGIQEAVYWMQR